MVISGRQNNILDFGCGTDGTRILCVPKECVTGQ